MRINGVDYSVAPVADGQVAKVTVSAAAAGDIPTKCFFADLFVSRADGSSASRMMVSGMVVERPLSAPEKGGNVVPVILMPDFKVPQGGGGDVQLPMTVRKTASGSSQEYRLDIVDDDDGIDLTIERA